jgi:NAD(P)H-hydrate repair Nnr-like enzyme with NAD(P)H-hydrate epimerase domain
VKLNCRDNSCRNQAELNFHESNERFNRARFNNCYLTQQSGKIDTMKITKNIGMLLLAVYLIIDGLLGFGLNLGPAIFLLYLVALAAGIFILIGK